MIAAETATAASEPPTRRPRIAFLGQEDIAVPPPIPGASVQRVVYELALELRDRFEITIASPPHPTLRDGIHEGIRYIYVRSRRDELVTRVAKETIRIVRRLDLPYRPLFSLPFYATGYARRGLRMIAGFDPDVVHLQMASQFLPIARAAAPRAKLVIHMHADWLVELPRETVRERLGHADLILGVSEHVTDLVRGAFPEYADRCECLYNGVDAGAFPARDALSGDLRALADRERDRLGLGGGPVILFAGWIAVEKGYDVLLEALPRILEELPDAKLLVVSPGIIRYAQVAAPSTRPERRAQRERFRDYPALIDRLAAPLRERVIETGGAPHDRLAAYYSLADVVAIPSTWHEALSLIALEASACGVPVVASDGGGLPESVLDGVTGTLVPAGDPVALAHAVTRICSDPTLARRLGQAGRDRVEREFTWRVQAQRLATLYDTLLSDVSSA